MENQELKGTSSVLSPETMLNERYKIIKHLYTRKYSNLYLATDTKFRENVYVRELFVHNLFERADDGKNIDLSKVDSGIHEEYMSKFDEEARFLRQHPNKCTIPVTDMFHENNTSYYVMEYVEGELLSNKMIRHNQPLSESAVTSILGDLLVGISEMHSQGFWHLDLTPSNMLIDTNGKVKIMDYGCCKLVNDENTISTSQNYDPKELQLKDVNNIGPWTDFYILGATVYNLLTGKRPPLASEVNETTSELYHFPTSVSKKMQRLVLWMMTPNIFRRPQDVGEISDFLVGMQESSFKGNHSVPKGEDTIIPASAPHMSVDNEDMETDDDDDEAGLSNKTLKAMQIFIFAAICAVVGYFAYKAIFGGDSKEKSDDKNEMNIKKEKTENENLVDSTRTEADIFTPLEDEKKEEKADSTSQKTEEKAEPEKEKEDKEEKSDEKQEPEIKNEGGENVENTSGQTPEASPESKDVNSQPSDKPSQQDNGSETDNKPQNVIVGFFENQDNANNRLNELKADGLNGTIITTDNGYRVVISAPNSAKAKEYLDKVKSKYSDAYIGK